MTVQTSMWLIWLNNSIDGISPTVTFPQTCNIGVLTLGGSKTLQRRWVAGVNVFSTTPTTGSVLLPDDTPLTAELWADVPIITGTSGFLCKADRITPPDWDYLTATWNNRKTATTWPTAGGEISTPQIAFNSPTALGYQKITDLASLLADAMSNRSGLLQFRLKADGEGATDHYFALQSDPDNEGVSPGQARLIVTYTRVETVPRQVPGAKGPVVRPRFDHILNVRPSGERVREIENIGEGLRRATRNRLGDRHGLLDQHGAGIGSSHPPGARHGGRGVGGVPGHELRPRARRIAARGG